MMSNHTSEPLTRWETSDLEEFLEFFKQQCKLYFSLKGIPEKKRKKQDEHILLLLLEEGLRRYNSWSFGNEADRRNPAVIWEKFPEQTGPQINFRIARFYSENYSQKETENIDDFPAICRLQAQKCKFRDECEIGEWEIDQTIAGKNTQNYKKQLFRKTRQCQKY